jgi:hypothetical protein
MNAINAALSAVFDVLLAPFGHRWVAFDLLVWPVVAGVVALLVYKRLSNQAGIARAKNGIVVNLLQVMLFRDDLAGVLGSTARAMGKNLAYLGHNLFPMAVMIVPMTAIMVQLVANYARDPVPVGAIDLVTARLDPNVAAVKATDVRLSCRTASCSTRRRSARPTARSSGACVPPPRATTCCASMRATR